MSDSNLRGGGKNLSRTHRYMRSPRLAHRTLRYKAWVAEGRVVRRGERGVRGLFRGAARPGDSTRLRLRLRRDDIGLVDMKHAISRRQHRKIAEVAEKKRVQSMAVGRRSVRETGRLAARPRG